MKKVLYAAVLLGLLMLLCLFVSSPQMVAFAETVFAPLPTNCPAPYKPDPAGYTQDNSQYSDASITVTTTRERVSDTDMLIAVIEIKDPTQLRTAMAGPYGSGKTQAVWRMAKKVNAVFAINGDWLDMYKGGVVVRNGKMYRSGNVKENHDILMIDDKGDFHILLKPTNEAYSALADNYTAAHVFSFGPGLVVDGKAVTEFPTSHACGIQKMRGRLALGQIDTLKYCVIAAEDSSSRTGDDDAGMTIPDFAKYIESLGFVKQAYNLDGGHSIYVDMNNTKLSSPYNRMVRFVGDIVYFATLVPDGGK